MASRTLESKRDSLCYETRRLEITQVLPAVKMGEEREGEAGRRGTYMWRGGRMLDAAGAEMGEGTITEFRKKGKPLKEME